MSHAVVVQTEFKHYDCLVKACARMPMPEPHVISRDHQTQVPNRVSMKMSNDWHAGVNLITGEFAWDSDFRSRKEGLGEVDRLKRFYNVETTRAAAIADGFSIEGETVMEDGNIKVEAVRY